MSSWKPIDRGWAPAVPAVVAIAAAGVGLLCGLLWLAQVIAEATVEVGF